MRKMLTSKLKSNESWFLAANRSTLLCAYTLLKANWLPAPSHPTTPPPAGAALLPSIPRAGLWMGGEQFLPHHEHFPRGKSVELLLSQNSVPSPWKRKITIGSCSFSKLASQERPSGQSELGSTNSLKFVLTYDRISLPLYQAKWAFPAPLSLTYFLISTKGPDTQRKGERNRVRKRAEYKIEV